MSGFLNDLVVAELRASYERFVASGRGLLGVVALGDPLWLLVGPENEFGLGRDVIQGTPQEIGEAIRDGIPPGWHVLKGRAARNFLRAANRAEESRWKAGRN